MAFKKGTSGNANGRKKGKPNKVTQSTKEFIASLIVKNHEKMEEDLNSLRPLERLQVLEKLMAYAIPKKTGVEFSNDSDVPVSITLNLS